MIHWTHPLYNLAVALWCAASTAEHIRAVYLEADYTTWPWDARGRLVRPTHAAGWRGGRL